MVKVVIELEIPDLIFDMFCRLHSENPKESFEKIFDNLNGWGIKAKILEMPEKKTLTSIEI